MKHNSIIPHRLDILHQVYFNCTVSQTSLLNLETDQFIGKVEENVCVFSNIHSFNEICLSLNELNTQVTKTNTKISKYFSSTMSRTMVVYKE